MATLDPDEGNVPWGKYTYALEGLATGCYMEGIDTRSRPPHQQTPAQRLCFRVELPDRCFVLSVSVKLPNAPPTTLHALDDIVIERALSNGEYQVVYDGLSPDSAAPLHSLESTNSKPVPADDPSHDSPTSVEQTSSPRDTLPRKKVMDVRRAADSLRLVLTDIEDNSAPIPARRAVSDSDASDALDYRTLGITVVGYTRGQTPASNRLKILLNSSARLPLNAAKADRAEVDGLLGLAFLGSRRYRQAAELLQRASELILDVASEDAKSGFAVDNALTWAAELSLLSAHAYFEHMPVCNDGIIRLIQVATITNKSPRASQTSPRDVRDLAVDYLDLRTELLDMLQQLIYNLVNFLSQSKSVAVRMASAGTIEFISEQIGCGMAPYMSVILNQVLRSYHTCQEFGARERAAAASFTYDSMEDCYEHLIDICCRLFPLTEHSVLHRLYDHTLVPVFLDGFHESSYLQTEPDGEEADEMTTTAVAQTLRVIYLVLSILGADARIPTSLITRLLNILVLDSGFPRTPLLLRRTALHTWDALSKTLIQTASGNSVKAFEDHLRTLTSYFPKLLVQTTRVGFEYRELEEDNGADVQIYKDEQVSSSNGSDALERLLKMRTLRTEIADRHTLRRVLTLITAICGALAESAEGDDIVQSEVLFSLQERTGQAITNVAMSSLLDVSYHEAVESGNGSAENNISFEFGNINNQLTIIGEILGELFECYWTSLSLLPSRLAEEAVRGVPVRTFLGWCVDRMKYAAPPKGMLRILCACVKGLSNEANVCMFGASTEPDNPKEVTFLSIYRALLQWLPQSTHDEAFDLLDILHESVAGDLLACDLLALINGLGDQNDAFQARTEASLESIATIIAACTPKDPEQAVKSLKDVPESKNGKQRLSNVFPKTPRANTGSFNKRMFVASQQRPEPIVKAFYLHVVLASCFDRFDALAQATQRRAGPSFMGDKIDAFVEHAALAVRCLHVCARSQSHREYIIVILGDIFGTCLAMEDYTDSRVRLAGFEIFAGAIDVLFLAKKATNLGTPKASIVGGDNTSMNIPTGAITASTSLENMNGITELSSPTSEEVNGTSGLPFPRSLDLADLGKTGANTSALSSPREGGSGEGKSNGMGMDDEDEEGERKMKEILGNGGSWRFVADETISTDLTFENRAWQMLCAFISSSLGVGRYVDIVVQRACLEYLRNCMMNALRGRSSGANVIAFEHIEVIWEAVSRLVGSPWRALNSLAMWVTCAVVNVSVYATIISKGKGPGRQRSTQLNDFATNHVFRRAESLLKNASRESRVWGMRLLEVYVRSRDLNSNIGQAIPAPPTRILRCLQTLKNDWNEDIRERSQSLLEVHFNSLNRKSSANSFTAHAHSFMSMKRSTEEFVPTDSSNIELWFPPLPDQLSDSELKSYQCNLDAFASNEIVSGEEVDLVKGDENEEDEDEDEGVYDDDDEGYEVDSDEKEVAHGEEEESDKLTDGSEEYAAEEDEDQSEEQDEEQGSDLKGENDTSTVKNNEGKDESVAGESISEESNELLESPSSPTSSTDADCGSDPDDAEELERPNLGNLGAIVRVESEEVGEEVGGEEDDNAVHEEEDDDDDVVEDQEFSSLGSSDIVHESTPAAEDRASADTNVDVDAEINANTDGDTDTDMDADIDVDVDVDADGEVDEFGLVPIKTTGSFGEDDEVEEDELVVDVTDEDDVLVDVDSVPEGKVMTNRIPGASASFNSLAPSQRRGSMNDVTRLKRPNSWSRPSGSDLSMNPDLDEGVQVLRRKGSFTSRPTSGFTLEEGDVPKLARRRSVDLTGLAGHAEGGMEGDESSPKLNNRLSRRKHNKTPNSINKNAELGRSKSTDGGGVVGDKGKEGAPDGDGSSSSSGSKSFRRKQKSVAELVEEKEALEHKLGRDRGVEYGSDMVKGGGSSSKGARTMKGVKVDEDVDGADDFRRPLRSPGGLYGSGLHRNSKSGEILGRSDGSRQNRRSLPRAPAFVKGGLLPRNSGSLTGSRSDGGMPTIGSTPTGSSSSPALSDGVATPRTKLPRGKSLSGRSSRMALTGDMDGSERKADRSHRFGRREPLNLPLRDTDEADEDLLNEVDDGSYSERKNAKMFSPPSESLDSRHGVVDEAVPKSGSSSYRRRGSKRNILDSPQYQVFLNDMGTKMADEGGRSDNTPSGKDADRADKSLARSDRKEDEDSKE